MRILICIAALLYCCFGQDGTTTPAPEEKCPSFFSGTDCDQIKCVNGYLDPTNNKICVCPPGYLGVQCEAVKTSLVPVNHFQSTPSFNIMNFNVWTQFWGIKTYANIQKTVNAHAANQKNYAQYWLFETIGTPKLDDFDVEDYSDFKQSVDQLKNGTTSSFGLADGFHTGLYWCYNVKIYENIVNFVKTASLKNSVITIITQHPPDDDHFEEAREITASFGIQLNVLWVSDSAYNFCTDKTALAQIANFQKLVENTGGLFVRLQSTEDDQTTSNLVSRVLMTHTKAQIVAMESRQDCSTAQSISFAVDPNINNPYYFTFSGENATTTGPSFTGCGLQNVATSYDSRITNFESNNPQCTSFEIRTTTGPCTAMVYTYDNLADRVGVDIYVTYVENTAVDASRYAVIHDVPFYPAIHIEPGKTPGTNVNVTSIKYVIGSNQFDLQFERREKAAYEWTTQKTLSCDANSEQHLLIGVQVNSVVTQRAFRINCLPTPPVTTIAPTTIAPTTATTVPIVTSTTLSTVTGASKTTTVTETTETSTQTTTTFASTSTVVETTTTPTTTTIAPTTTQDCKNGKTDTTFLFAYSTELNLDTYGLSRNAIVQAISTNLFDYSFIANIRFDTNLNPPAKIAYESDQTQFISDLKLNQPNSNIASGQNLGSNFLSYIQDFLIYGNSTQNSVVLLLVNRFPTNSDDLNLPEYDKLTNLNIKIFPIISQNALLSQKDFLSTRSGAVLNKIAALTNGHYIFANETIGRDVTSDYSRIVESVMQFGYGQDLLYTRNFHGQRLNSPLGTIRIPTASTPTIKLTITISLSVSDSKYPSLPDRLLLAFLPANNVSTVSVDFRAATQFSSSNFFIATVELPAGVDRNMVLQYQAGDDQNDLLLRIWTDKTFSHEAQFVYLNGTVISTPDDVNGASLQFTIKSECQKRPSEIVITDCNGDISTKYDVRQTANALENPDNGFPQFNFVPFFCDSQTANCIPGADNKYDIQLISDGYSITRSFLCRKSPVNHSPNCINTDSYGNYQCSGASVPFKRGPTGKLNDCSGHGSLFYNENIFGDVYSDKFECKCDSDQFKGVSCQEVTCELPNPEKFAYDNTYRTYTVVLGIDSDTSTFTLIRDDSKGQLGIDGMTELPNIWKYQLLVYCADGQVESLYTGGDLVAFKTSFKQFPKMQCNQQANSATVNLENVYSEAVRGVGKNVKGIIVYFTESPFNLNVSVDDFIAASQTYQQQMFVFTADEPEPEQYVKSLNSQISNAVMSTGGFLVQSRIDSDGNINTLFPKFIPDLLSAQSSISFVGIQLSSGFNVLFEKGSTTYLLISGRGDGIKLDGVSIDKKECEPVPNAGTVCKFENADAGLKAITNVNGNSPTYDAIVYVVKTGPSVKGQIISDLQKDTTDAVSTTSSVTRSIVSFHVPENYNVVANTNDDGLTRSAKRNNCEFQYTTYSVFADSKYEKGANFAQITLQSSDDAQITRYFLFGTTDQAACFNGGDVNQSTGSCQCQSGFTGPDCSLVDCSVVPGAVENAWKDVCVCEQIDDSSCASAYTKKMFF